MPDTSAKKRPLSRQLIKQLLILGLILTLCFTGLQAWLTYQARMTEINTTIEQIKKTEITGLSNSLWEYNIKWLHDQARGMLHFPYISYVAIKEQANDSMLVEAGENAPQNRIEKTMPLVHAAGKEEQHQIGTLIIHLNSNMLFREIWKDIIMSFLFQILNVAIILISLLILVKNLITNHLAAAANYFQQFDVTRSSTPSLHLQKQYYADEIDIMVIAFNDLRQNLLAAYREQVKAREKIKESEKLFRVMIEKAPEAIIVYDAQAKKIVDANVKALALFDCDRQTLLHGGPERFYLQKTSGHNTLAESMQANLSRALQGEEVLFERTIIHEDGAKLICEVRLVTLPYEAHQWLRISYIDITERLQLIEEQKQMQRQLYQAQKAEALGVLAGGIAHDFNNILSAIIGYTELSITKIAGNHGVSEHLEKVLLASRRARDLVKQILAFSRRSEVDKIPLKLVPLVKESLKMLRASMPATISITEEYPQEPCTILADPTQIHQVIMNLCTNAYQAMNENGGHLAITMKTVHNKATSTTSPLLPGKYVELAIGDNGCGISPDIIEKIFDPYFTTKEIGKGTGLGLAIIKKIVDSSDGGIIVESTPGQGSTFRVFFPLVHTDMPTMIEVEEIPQGKGSILLVDDETLLMELGKNQLETLGYSVTAVNSSPQALQLFTEDPEHFDVVVTDQTMPEMTGVALAEHILQIRPDMPIILVTGYSHLVDEQLAKKIGIREFALKPLTKATLAGLIQKVHH